MTLILPFKVILRRYEVVADVLSEILHFQKIDEHKFKSTNTISGLYICVVKRCLYSLFSLTRQEKGHLQLHVFNVEGRSPLLAHFLRQQGLERRQEPTSFSRGQRLTNFLHILLNNYCIRGYFCGGFIFVNFASQSRRFQLQYMAIYSNENITKISKIKPSWICPPSPNPKISCTRNIWRIQYHIIAYRYWLLLGAWCKL